MPKDFTCRLRRLAAPALGIGVKAASGVQDWPCFSGDALEDGEAQNQENYEQKQREEEQHLRDRSRSSRNPGEAEHSRDQRNDEKHQSPLEHDSKPPSVENRSARRRCARAPCLSSLSSAIAMPHAFLVNSACCSHVSDTRV